jgi:type II secretory pathway component PulM
MFESMIVKMAVGWLCIVPAVIFGANLQTAAEKVVLFGGAITAAAVVWGKVVRPLMKSVQNLNDAYNYASVAEQEIREIKQDLHEIKEKLNGT